MENNDTEIKSGLIATKENYDIVINDDNISFKCHEGNSIAEMNIDELLDIIIKNVKTKPHVLALTNIDTKTIDVAEVERTYYFKADKVINEGEEFTINIKHPYPYNLMVIEEMYNIAKQAGDVVQVPLSYIEEAKKNIDERNVEFVKNFYQLTDENLENN